MKWFRCFVAGENFPGALTGEKGPTGFYLTCYVEASSEEEAEMKALDSLRNSESLKLPEGVSPSANAKVHFEEIVEIAKTDVSEKQHGFTFYPMGN